MKLLFDTDVLIDFLRGYEKSRDFISKNQNSIFLISVITIAELFAGIKNNKEKEITESFLSHFIKVEINELIAQKAGLYKNKYYKSHNVGLADSIIACSAEEAEATLITLNKKHYPMVKDIIVPYKKY